MTTTQPLQEAADLFLAERPRLLRLAHRVVGDGAEDVLQDVWLRWQRVDHDGVQNPAAFLTTATRRVALNVVQSARHRHEQPAQEPIERVAADADPSARADRAASVEDGLTVLMSRLTPAELAALVLRASFGYPYDELARLLGTNPARVRQLVHRARLGLARDRSRPVDRRQRRRLVTAFLRASEGGDMADLVALLAEAIAPSPSEHAA